MDNHSQVGNDLEGVAVIGMSCRFPGATSVAEFWKNLCEGVESVTFLSDEDLKEAGVSPDSYRAANYVKASPRLVEDVGLFDAAFFDFSARQAEVTDPQHRLFLECAWEALESAGYDPERSGSRVGVWAGAYLNTYASANLLSNASVRASTDSMQLVLASDRDYLATLVSYKLNLRGPSICVQSACSTSLVAVSMACQSLLTYQCDMALAGGATVTVPQNRGYFYTEGGILSPDGHCRAFDASAQGTVFGSGVGAVVLKRLEDAVADGDSIDAVIKASAINNDGALKAGFSAPSVQGQAEVIATAQALADFEVESIRYVETHGTGTSMGDPIEVAALEKVFSSKTSQKRFCALGSLKTNVGHLSAAAGVAGLIKTALALKHRRLPPSLHFVQPNPQIDFDNSPFYVNTELAEWKGNGGPLRAGVSSFGIGGTNAHLILEEAPPRAPAGPSRPWQLLAISAKTESALEKVAANLARHLEQSPEASLADVAYTLNLGRKMFPYRRSLVCRGLEDALEVLTGRHPKRIFSDHQEPGDRPVAFLFPGQGAQYANMGRELYETEPAFRKDVDHCLDLLLRRRGLDLKPLIFPSPEGVQEASRRLAQTSITQPALFVVEYALAKLWMSWGVQPDSMIGHSIGEYAAACLAGTFQLEDALDLVALRGELMQGLPPGVMLSVPLPGAQVEPLMEGGLSLSAVNGPSQCVVGGDPDAAQRLQGRLADQGVKASRLHTSHAFHSPMVEPILQEFAAQVEQIELKPPRIPFLSNVTGSWIGDEDATDPGYWARHCRQAVRFADGLGELLQEPNRILLEVGPGNTLSTLCRRHGQWSPQRAALPSLPHPEGSRSDAAYLLNTLGRLWLAGLAIDWEGFYAGQKRQRVNLPTYPFQRQRYWIDAEPLSRELSRAREAPPKRREIEDWFHIPVWKQSMPPLPEDPQKTDSAASRWLIFADDCGLGAEMAGRMRKQGRQAVMVSPGQGFAQLEESSYALRPGSRQDYTALVEALSAGQKLPDRVLHLWCLTPKEASSQAKAEGLMDRAFYSLLYLAQSLGEAGQEQGLRIEIVSNGLWRLGSEELPQPEKALLLGPARVIPQEYLHIWCRSIDVALPQPGRSQEPLISQVAAELDAADAFEPLVAYRGDQRWIQSFQAVRLEDPGAPAARLRDQGVYLISGGLGGLGLAVAHYLAQAVQARLILTGRSALPAREAWDAWLKEHGETDSVSSKILQIRELEQSGAQVVALAADVTDEAQMRQAVQQARQAFGGLNGVIHCAGIAGEGGIAFKTREAAQAVLDPKVRGTQVLASVVQGLPLDFLVLFSSTLSLIGRIGQVDYCAANAFLDAFAHFNSACRNQFTLSLNWDLWAEVGMGRRAMQRGAAPSRTPEAARAPQSGQVIGAPSDDQGQAGGSAAHPLLGSLVRQAEDEEVYAGQVSSEHWLLNEHRILGMPVMPGVAFLEMARAAFQSKAAEAGIELRNVRFLSPLMVRDGEVKQLRTVLHKNGQAFSFTISARTRPEDNRDAPWQEYAAGTVGACQQAGSPATGLAERAGASPQGGSGPAVREPTAWGPTWRSIQKKDLEAGLTQLQIPQEAADLEAFPLYPPLLDVATSWGALRLEGLNYLPHSYKSLKFYRPLSTQVYVWFEQKQNGAREDGLNFDVTILDPQGHPLVAIEGFRLEKVSEQQGARQPPSGADELIGSAGPRHATGSADALVQGIPSRQGMDAFNRVLARATVPQIVISPRDLSAALKSGGGLAPGAEESPAPRAEAGAGSKHPRPQLQTPYVAPRNPIELQIAELWQLALGFEEVGIHDDFFELGGHSVMAVQLISRLRTHFGVEIPASSLFQASTVAELAEVIEPGLREGAAQARPGQEQPAAPSAPEAEPAGDGQPAKRAEAAAPTAAGRLSQRLARVPRQGRLQLSYAQQRQWFLVQLEPDSQVFNVARSTRLRGRLNVAVLRRCFDEILRRHEALRTTFPAVDGTPVQVISTQARLVLPLIDLSGLAKPARQREEKRLVDENLWRLFDLGRDLLLRVLLLQVDREEYVGLISTHHIAADAWSVGLLLQELGVLYEAFAQGKPSPLPELPIQYADFAAWQRRWLQGEALEREIAYWRHRLAGAPASLELTRARTAKARPRRLRPAVRLPFTVSQELTQALDQLSRQEGTTIFMTLLAAFKILLHRYSGQEDIIVGTPVAGRDREELENLIGYFLNALPLRTDLSGNPTFRQLLKRVREGALEAFAHQSIPFEKLVEELHPQRKENQFPYFQHVFNFYNGPMPQQVELPEVTLGFREFESEATKYDLTLYMFETPNMLIGNLSYNPSLFEAATMSRIERGFKALLQKAAQDPDLRLSALERLIRTEEREDVLTTRSRSDRGRDRLKQIRRKAVRLPAGDRLVKPERGQQ